MKRCRVLRSSFFVLAAALVLASALPAQTTGTPSLRCAPQDAQGEGPCALFLGWRWDGRQCVGESGCDCVGADCDSLFPTLEQCQATFCRCLCEPQDVEGIGGCEVILGWFWTGGRCLPLSGCSCVGDDCPNLFPSLAECNQAHASCPCAAQDAFGQGGCALFLGWKWNGRRCEGVSGCSCTGTDCGNLFQSLDECRKEHGKCLCRAEDARGEGPCDQVLGWRWDGERCEELSGCNCVGLDCDLLAASFEECYALHRDCPCRDQDAVGVGPCTLLLGWKWDGAACVGVSGCSCSGVDCGALATSQAACAAAHADCLCRPQDARGVGPCDEDLGWRWDGVECVPENGCECKGGDCDELYATQTECLGAHRACPCRSQDAVGVGSCALFLGYKWNGVDCEGVSGCSCSGSDCGNLFQDLAACRQAHADCDPCCGCNTCEPAAFLPAG